MKKKRRVHNGGLRQELGRCERRLQGRKKVETLNLGKNLLALDKKVIICVFERKSSGKSMEMNRGSGRRRNGGRRG